MGGFLILSTEGLSPRGAGEPFAVIGLPIAY